jgi:hypothetical protein
MATLRTRGGIKLTKKVIDALVEEAERGYDLTKAKRVRMGRPALGDGGSSPRVQLRVDPALDKALRAMLARSTAQSAR